MENLLIQDLHELNLFMDEPLYMIPNTEKKRSFLETVEYNDENILFIFNTEVDHYTVNANNDSVFDRMIEALSTQKNVSLNMDSIAFWYAKDYQEAIFKNDLKSSNIKKVVVLGFDVELLGWEIGLEKYTVSKHNSIDFLWVDSLVNINNDTDLKKTFWKNMLQMFKDI